MMPTGTSATLLGGFVGSLIALGPKVFDKLTGKKKDAADGATVISTGASAVTTAALALLAQHQEDADRARDAEERCQVRLGEVSARCDKLEHQVLQLSALHASDPLGE